MFIMFNTNYQYSYFKFYFFYIKFFPQIFNFLDINNLIIIGLPFFKKIDLNFFKTLIQNK